MVRSSDGRVNRERKVVGPIVVACLLYNNKRNGTHEHQSIVRREYAHEPKVSKVHAL